VGIIIPFEFISNQLMIEDYVKKGFLRQLKIPGAAGA
jgi:hypothetical protein